MYIPAAFRVDDHAAMLALIQQHGFATLITGDAEPFISHLPLLVDPSRGPHGTLIGHFARPNPHWRLDHARLGSVAIFHGPHAYISPTWYRSGNPAVPTWNYAVVHAWGKLVVMDDAARVAEAVAKLVEKYESHRLSPWRSTMPRELMDKFIASIVAFEMPIERVEGKFKLGQNRAAADQVGAIEALESSGDAESAALATFARGHLGHSRH